MGFWYSWYARSCCRLRSSRTVSDWCDGRFATEAEVTESRIPAGCLDPVVKQLILQDTQDQVNLETSLSISLGDFATFSAVSNVRNAASSVSGVSKHDIDAFAVPNGRRTADTAAGGVLQCGRCSIASVFGTPADKLTSQR
jgi:hypothetical protein